MSEEEAKQEIQVVIFRLQKEEFGIEINKVREIVPMINITRLPSSSDSIMVGVINLRGQLIPIIQLSKLFNLPLVSTLPKTARIVVAEVNHIVVGMIVDEVPHVLKIASKNIEPPPEIMMQKICMEYIQGVGKIGDRLIIMLDVVRLLQPHDTTIQALKKDHYNG